MHVKREKYHNKETTLLWVRKRDWLFQFESIFLSRVEGRGFHVEGEGTKSRVEGNIFFFQFFFLEKVIIDAINVIKTNKKNLKNKWRGNIF